MKTSFFGMIKLFPRLINIKFLVPQRLIFDDQTFVFIILCWSDNERILRLLEFIKGCFYPINMRIKIYFPLLPQIPKVSAYAFLWFINLTVKSDMSWENFLRWNYLLKIEFFEALVFRSCFLLAHKMFWARYSNYPNSDSLMFNWTQGSI